MSFQSSKDIIKAIDPTGDSAKWSLSPYKKKLKTESLFESCNSKIRSKSNCQTQTLALNPNYIPNKTEVNKNYYHPEIPNLNIIYSINKSKINKKQDGLILNFKRSPRDLKSRTILRNLTQETMNIWDNHNNINTKKTIQHNSKDKNTILEQPNFITFNDISNKDLIKPTTQSKLNYNVSIDITHQ